MNTRIHGHEVLKMMIASGHGYTRDSLRAMLIERFGETVRFDACTAQGMSADELINFLESRNKFREKADGWYVHEEEICDG